MTVSPAGFPFENIDFDAGQMSTMYDRLIEARDAVDRITLVTRNVTANLEGKGKALDRAREAADTVAASFFAPAERVGRIAAIVRTYAEAAETHAGLANRLMATVTEAMTAVDTAAAGMAEAQSTMSTWQNSSEYRNWVRGEDTLAPSWALSARHGAYQASLTIAMTAHSTAESTLEDAWSDWERAYRSWDDAYGKAVADLAGVESTHVPASDAPLLSLLANADTPAEVAAVWETLSENEKSRLGLRYPDLIGNLEGVPYEHRIAANIWTLEQAARQSWGDPTDAEIAALLTELRDNGGVPISLNLFDKNQATAAVLYVDGFAYDSTMLVDPLDGVDNVNVLLGGMLTELSQIADWGESARDINEKVSGTTASIVWFGYDTPNYGSVLSSDQARTGAESLTSALRGLDLAAPRNAITSVIGHSYGSTTAFLAVGSADDNLGVDRLIAIGSAGLSDRALGHEDPGGIDYSGTEIYSSTAPEDNWARKGRWWPSDHPIDPGSLDGAVSFDSNGGYDPDGDFLLPTPGHGTHEEGDFTIGTTGHPGGYLDRGSESFANIANIIENGESLTTPGGAGSDDWWLW